MDEVSLLTVQRQYNWYLPWSLLLYDDLSIWGIPRFRWSRLGFHIDELGALLHSIASPHDAVVLSSHTFTPHCNLHSLRLTGLSSVECPFSSVPSAEFDNFETAIVQDLRLCQLNETALEDLLSVVSTCERLEFLAVRGGEDGGK